MEEQNKTEALMGQENSLDIHKPQILAKIKEHIEKDTPPKTKKKKSKFIEQVLKADVDKLSFGESPTYETGYVHGSITAEGSRVIGDTTYTNTITLDLQTPEYVFFNMNKDDNLRERFKRACLRLGPRHFVNTAKKHVTSSKQISKVYVSDYEDEALQDYATIICEEQLARLNYSIDECQVYDYDFVETQETRNSNIYPVYLTVKDKKGKNVDVLIGYYSAEKDDIYCDIDFNNVTASDVLSTILGAMFFVFIIIPPAIAVIAAIVMIIGTLIGVIQW